MFHRQYGSAPLLSNGFLCKVDYPGQVIGETFCKFFLGNVFFQICHEVSDVGKYVDHFLTGLRQEALNFIFCFMVRVRKSVSDYVAEGEAVVQHYADV